VSRLLFVSILRLSFGRDWVEILGLELVSSLWQWVESLSERFLMNYLELFLWVALISILLYDS
jgi:hypothetical protein